MLRVVQAAAAEDRIGAAAEFLRALPASARVLLLRAGREGAMDLLREATARRGALCGFRSLPLDHVAAALCRPGMFEAGLAPLPALGATAICARLIAQRDGDGTLGRLGPVAEQPGLPAALAQTLGDLRLAEITPDALHDDDPDLAALLSAYGETLRARGLQDRAGMLRRARQAVAGTRAPDAILALDLPLSHRLEAGLLSALFATTPRALLTCPAGDARSLRLLRAETELSIETPASAAASTSRESLGRVQRHLFDADAPTGTLGSDIELLSAPGEARECVEIARKLLWETERGTRFEEMAVLCQAAPHYRVHVAEALRRAGIPAYFAAGSTRPDPGGRGLLALLACRQEGLCATRFAEYLSLGVVPPRQPGGAPPEAIAAADRALLDAQAPDDEAQAEADAPEQEPALAQPRGWERALVDAAVIGGRGRWERRLQALRETLGERDPAELSDAERTALQARRAQLQELQAFALPLLDALCALPDAASWGAWIEALSALCTRAIRRPQRVLSVLAELLPMADLGPVEIEEVRRVLAPRLSELSQGAGADRGGRVFVGTPEQARGMCFEVVCVPGLSERIFPRKVREDPLLLDAVRRRLDAELATQRDGVDAERLALRIAVGAARRRLVLSYPRIDPERARPRVPSFYGLELLRAAEGVMPDYGELISRAEAATPTRAGWPAPRDGHDALDAAEHDLSLLQRLLDEDPERTVGAARYLLDANPHLARALRFRARRWNVHGLTAADGLWLPGDAALAALAEHRPDRRAYSATALQHFAACPYRFLLHAIHHLSPEPRPAPLEQLDHAQRGRIFHEAQFRILSALRAQAALPVTDGTLDAALQTLDAELSQIAERMRELLAPAIDHVFEDGIARLRGDLRQWLRRSVDHDGWVPVHFELSFGVRADDRPHDPDSRPEPIDLGCGILLRGAIDLVERRGDRLRAIDHKTGTAPPDEPLLVGGGERLQPLLYALSLRAAFPDARVDGGELYYCTGRGGYQRRTVPLDSGAETAARQLATTIDDALRQGTLPALPVEHACAHCDYRVVCGPYEEQRTARKDGSAMGGLARLRSMR